MKRLNSPRILRWCVISVYIVTNSLIKIVVNSQEHLFSFIGLTPEPKTEMENEPTEFNLKRKISESSFSFGDLTEEEEEGLVHSIRC